MSLLMFIQERCSALEFALNLIQCGLNANSALKFAFKRPSRFLRGSILNLSLAPWGRGWG